MQIYTYVRKVFDFRYYSLFVVAWRKFKVHDTRRSSHNRSYKSQSGKIALNVKPTGIRMYARARRIFLFPRHAFPIVAHPFLISGSCEFRDAFAEKKRSRLFGFCVWSGDNHEFV